MPGNETIFIPGRIYLYGLLQSNGKRKHHDGVKYTCHKVTEDKVFFKSPEGGEFSYYIENTHLYWYAAEPKQIKKVKFWK